jgi:hypothetical protein
VPGSEEAGGDRTAAHVSTPGSAGGGVERVGVLGCGLMGAGIAEVSARAGFDTVVGPGLLRLRQPVLIP